MTGRLTTTSYQQIRHNRWLKRLLMAIIILCGTALIASITYMVMWRLDALKTNEQNQHLVQLANIEEVADTDNTHVVDSNADPSNPYWDYIKMKLIDVNFDELKKINSDTVGWLQVGGTNINYPFVQADNNSYYLTHSFDKSYNAAGWVYLDYRNNPAGNDKNSIIYAHSRLDQTMFGSLKNILTNGWLSNPDNFVVKLSTPYENTLWQVFSVYHLPTTDDYLQTSFSSSQEFTDFANKLIDRSAHNFHTSVNAGDQILTLSTCYGYTDRVVLHAKLIKSQPR